MRFKSLFPLVLLFLSILSCSSDDGESSTDDGESFPSIDENTFTITMDGEVINLVNITGQISENEILVFGQNDAGDFAQVGFHKEGNLGNITVAFSTETGQFSNTFSTALFYSANSMDFDVIEVDEENNTVSAQFSGQLFQDDIDTENSASITVSGEFNASLIESVAQIPGLEFYAQIDGTDWYATFNTLLEDSNTIGITEWNYNDTQYGIGFRYEPGEVEVGTYEFVNSDGLNSMDFEDLNNIDDEFQIEGVLEIAEVTNEFSSQRVIGTFSFVATNSVTGEVINIENGRINTLTSN